MRVDILLILRLPIGNLSYLKQLLGTPIRILHLILLVVVTVDALATEFSTLMQKFLNNIA